ncbi:multicopper oxidase family protein [Nostoc sp. HG1]|nr:multicopper oxidase family protein [Nostoc sp. HG1]
MQTNKKSNFNLTRRIMLVGLGSMALVAGLAKIGHRKTNHPKQHITLKTGTFGNLDPASIKDTHRLRITPIALDIANGLIWPTIGYDGGSPGPILRMRAGIPTALEIFNESPHPETVHLHAQQVLPEIDGASEEGSPAIAPGGHLKFLFEPTPTGTHWYHTHAHTNGGLYTGQQGVLIVDGKDDPGNYDREVILITHDWHELMQANTGFFGSGPTFSINGKALGFGEPVRVKNGEKVLFRIVNGNAHQEIYLALPGHRFKIVALDGNPVPQAQTVEVLRMGSGERIDAIVEMNSPGVWILGDIRKDRRDGGLGIAIEYADKTGQPKWQGSFQQNWDYTLFGGSSTVTKPDEIIEMVFNWGWGWGNPWQVNGKPFWDQDTYQLKIGRRYRLILRNQSDELHPMHLHRHSFELTNIEGKSTSGIIKDTVCIEQNGHIEVDFIADKPGLSLFHCHMENHMKDGFMSLFETS